MKYIGFIIWLICAISYCIWLIWYIRHLEKKKFIKLLYIYYCDNKDKEDYHFYILNLYIGLYHIGNFIYSYGDYNKLLKKYNIYERV